MDPALEQFLKSAKTILNTPKQGTFFPTVEQLAAIVKYVDEHDLQGMKAQVILDKILATIEKDIAAQ
mgnify:CR=1 FL=1